MVRVLVVRGSVSIRRRITAADMAARETDSKMDPATADLQAIFATGWRPMNRARRFAGDVLARVRKVDRIVV
jgi:hypothetical protein